MTLTFQKYMTFTFTFNKCSLIYQISPIFFYQCREPSPVSCLPSLVSCLPSLVSCLLSPVFCLPSSVSRLLSHVPMSPVSRLPCCTVSAADLIYCITIKRIQQSYGADLWTWAIQHPNALSELSGLKANFFTGHEVQQTQTLAFLYVVILIMGEAKLSHSFTLASSVR